MSAFRLFEQTSRTKNKRGRNIWATLRFQQELMEKITVRYLTNVDDSSVKLIFIHRRSVKKLVLYEERVKSSA